MSTAFLFPGQGSQFVGMGKDHYDSNPAFADMVEQSNEILGFDLKSILFEMCISEYIVPLEKYKKSF